MKEIKLKYRYHQEGSTPSLPTTKHIKMEKKKREKVFFQLDVYADQKEFAEQIAKDKQTTRTDIIRRAIDAGLPLIKKEK